MNMECESSLSPGFCVVRISVDRQGRTPHDYRDFQRPRPSRQLCQKIRTASAFHTINWITTTNTNTKSR